MNNIAIGTSQPIETSINGSQVIETIINNSQVIEISVISGNSSISTLTNPLLFKGEILINIDFPTLAEVQTGRLYTITHLVIDNDPTKTNTGQTFKDNDEIFWNGTNWTIMGNESAKVDSFNTRTGDVVPVAGDYNASQVTNALDKTVDSYLEDVVAGTSINIDKTDPKNPIISSSGGVSEELAIAYAVAL